MICVFAIFHHFLNIFFWLSWFSFGLNSNFSSAWHDNQFFSLFFHDLSTPGNDACHRWPSRLKHLFLCKDCFGRVGFLVQSCLGHFYPKRGSWLKNISEKWVILVNMSQGINQRWFRGITVLGFCSAHGKRFGKFETVSKSWCTPNYQISVFSKTRHFLLPDFWRIRELVSKSGILRPIA